MAPDDTQRSYEVKDGLKYPTKLNMNLNLFPQRQTVSFSEVMPCLTVTVLNEFCGWFVLKLFNNAGCA